MKTALLCVLLPATFFIGCTVGAPVRKLIRYPTGFDLNSVGQFAAGGLTCDVCETVVAVLQQLFQTGTAEDDIVNIAINICIDLKIEDRNVCESIIPLFKVNGCMSTD